jgi:hypothetical protein
MQITKRQIFLDSFFKLLGAEIVEISNVEDDCIFGTVIYDINDPSERQDFCWRINEENMPSDNVLKIMKIINENNFIDIDKLTDPLAEIYSKTTETDYNAFLGVMDQLFKVEVRMVDDGEETDRYFVHN